jgi:polyphenol oxidase
VPSLERKVIDGVAWWTDSDLLDQHGVVIAFTERGGGVGDPPYASLNLAAHVGDRPEIVDENRSRLLRALGLEHTRERLTMAQQVHGDVVTPVGPAEVGAGAWAARGAAPIPATDALVTVERDVPLLMCFADCVPVILVAPGPCVAVVHAGWRSALAGIPALAARMLSFQSNRGADEISAYIGPHIGHCCYPVSAEILSQFVHAFVTVSRVDSTKGLDLGAAVTESLSREGVKTCSIANLGTCTAENTERFFSHRAEGGLTGRHGALACILQRD